MGSRARIIFAMVTSVVTALAILVVDNQLEIMLRTWRWDSAPTMAGLTRTAVLTSPMIALLGVATLFWLAVTGKQTPASTPPDANEPIPPTD